MNGEYKEHAKKCFFSDKDIDELDNCKTVEEVEQLRCNTCSRTGHWGWCDAVDIYCGYKARIKEILEIPMNENKYSAEDTIEKALRGVEG